MTSRLSKSSEIKPGPSNPADRVYHEPAVRAAQTAPAHSILRLFRLSDVQMRIGNTSGVRTRFESKDISPWLVSICISMKIHLYLFDLS
jgi:hypothetical protein